MTITKNSLKESLNMLGLLIGIIAGVIGIYNVVVPAEIKDMTGSWDLTFKIENSEFNRFVDGNLEYKFRIFITQDHNSIEAIGEKVWEKYKGKEHFYVKQQKTPIKIKGKINKRNLIANITEKGLERESSGSIKIDLSNENLIFEGTFISTAASSSGSAILTRSNH